MSRSVARSLAGGGLRTVVIGRSISATPTGGSAWRSLENVRALAELGPVAVYSLTRRGLLELGFPEQPAGVARWRPLSIGPRRGRIGTPLLRRAGWILSPSGHPQSSRWFDRKLVRHFADEVAAWRPDIVLCEELWTFRWLERLLAGPWWTILDEHNVETQVLAEMTAARPVRATPRGLRILLRQRLLARRTRLTERRALASVDQTWVCSAGDREALLRRFDPRASVRIVPNTVDLRYYSGVRAGSIKAPPDLAEANGPVIIFVGSQVYEPNRRAALWLMREIFPAIRRLHAHSRLLLVGSDPEGFLRRAAARDPAITVTGWVPDVRPYLAAASLAIVPLREGGGTRLKIAEAFAAGLPVLATPKAAEGIAAVDGKHLWLCRSAEEFAAGTGSLWEAPDRRAEMAKQAFALASEACDFPATRKAVREALEDLASK